MPPTIPLVSSFISKIWNVTLPTGKEKKPETIVFPALDTYSDSNFTVLADGIKMKCPTDGVTTQNSSYPRCEFRELTENGEKAAWDFTPDSDHYMEWVVIVSKIPAKKPHVCIGQIHDIKDDILEIRVEDKKLVARGRDINGYVPLMDFTLGKTYTFGISVVGGKTSFHNIAEKVAVTITQIPKDVKGCYFKCGNYVQSNPLKGDAKDFSEIILKSLKVTHSKTGNEKPPIEKPPTDPVEKPKKRKHCCCCCSED